MIATVNLGGLALFVAGSALASMVLLWVLLRSGVARWGAIDLPNARSLHSDPIPRCGGLGIVPVILAALLVFSRDYWVLGCGVTAVGVVSFIDDRRGLSARVRFLVHIFAVGAVLYFSALSLPWWLLAIAFLGALWAINLYNFMDGSDGLSGSVAVVGFAVYAVAAAPAAPQLALLCAAISGAALGFLKWNWPPAQLFMGDVGSISLGFLAGSIAILGWRDAQWPIWFGPLVFSPFVADATWTLAKRAARGERVWQAHREHYYQRLIQSGKSHRQTALIWSLLMIVTGALALTLLYRSPSQQVWGIAAWVAVLILIGSIIDRRWHEFIVKKGP